MILVALRSDCARLPAVQELSGRRYGVSGQGCLRQRRLRGARGRRARRRRQRRQRRFDRRFARGRGRQRRPGRSDPARQGDRGHEHHRPGLPGLPRRRLLHHPAAVADRREVPRLLGHRAAAARHRAAAAAAAGARGRARCRPVPASAREQRPLGRPGPDQQHLPAAVRAAFPDHPERTRRRPRDPRPGAERDDHPGQPDPARGQQGAGDPLVAEQDRWPSSQRTATTTSPSWPSAGPTWSASSATPATPQRRPPSAAKTSART